MTLLELIEQGAKKYGACEKADNITNYTDLVERLFSTQGATFVTNNAFPSLKALIALKPYVKDSRVFINKGNINVSGVDNVCIAGNTNAHISFSGGKCIHKVIVYYGAKCCIEATNRAVVQIYNIFAGDIETVKDGQSIILKERKFDKN